MPYGLLGSPAQVLMPNPFVETFSPRAIPGLVAWFDADDASTFSYTTGSTTKVSEWRDKSGNGYAVSQPTANNRPARTGALRGRACIDFDGTNDCLFSDGTALADAMNGDKSITVIVVGEMQNASEVAINALGTWVAFGSSASGMPLWYMRSSATSGIGQVQFRNDASSASGAITAAPGPAGDSASNADQGIDFFICSATSPSQSNQVWRTHTEMEAEGDGIGNRSRLGGGPLRGTVFTSTAARPSGTLTSNRFAIGCLGRNVFSDFFPGRLAEVIIYGRAIQDSERNRLVNFLSRKYNNVAVPVL